MAEHTEGMYKVYCEWLTAMPDSGEVFWKIWATSPQNARRKVFSMTRGVYELYAVTDRVEFCPDDPYTHYDRRAF